MKLIDQLPTDAAPAGSTARYLLFSTGAEIYLKSVKSVKTGKHFLIDHADLNALAPHNTPSPRETLHRLVDDSGLDP